MVDPYVKVRVCGLDCDDHNIVTNNKYTTKTINNNGFRYVCGKRIRVRGCTVHRVLDQTFHFCKGDDRCVSVAKRYLSVHDGMKFMNSVSIFPN